MTGIVILNYNNAQLTLSCIDSVIKYNSILSKYIIIDNASTDNSGRDLRNGLADRFQDNFIEYQIGDMPEHLSVCSFICSAKNGGYAQGNNIGLKLAENDSDIDTILILNNDIVFIDDIIPSLVSFLESKPNIGIVSPLLLKKNGKSIDYNCARLDCTLKEIACYYLLYCRDFYGILSKLASKAKILVNNPALINEPAIPIELPSGSCMLIKKDLFKNIGYFDPNTFLYYEESILYRKLRAINKINYLLPEVKCIHLGAQTTSMTNRSYSYLKNSNKSAYYYVMHYRDLNLFQKSAFSILYAIYSIVLYVKQHLKF